MGLGTQAGADVAIAGGGPEPGAKVVEGAPSPRRRRPGGEAEQFALAAAVQALAANAADHPLDERVLPGTARCGEQLFDAHALDSRSEGQAIRTVAIPEQVALHRFPGERLGDLVGGPLGGRVLRHVEVHHPAPSVLEDDDDEQDPEVTAGPT
jgi:hypothetical protein